jgi:hypothetical protein
MRRFVVAAFLLLAVSPALAQSDPRARADVPFKQGLALHDAGKDAEALAKFEEAYRIYPSANILFNVARMEQVLGRSADAMTHFRACLKDRELSADNRASAESHLRNLEKSFGKVKVDAPPGAQVKVDDEPEDAQEPVLVVPGKHKLEVTQGGKREVRDVIVGAGEIAVVKFTLESMSGAGAATTANASSASANGSGGAPSGDAGPEKPPTYWTTGHTVGILAMTGGLVATGVGVAFVVAANDAAHEVQAPRRPGEESACVGVTSPECRALANAADDRVRATNFATGFLVAGGALLLGGAIAYFAWPDSKKTSARAVRPMVEAGVVGASFGGPW